MNYIKALLVFAVVVLATQTTHAQSGDDYQGKMQTFAKYFNSQNYDSIYYLFEESLKIAAPYKQTTNKWRRLYNAHGPILGVRGEIYKNGLVHTTAFFADDSITILSKLHFQTYHFEVLRLMPYHWDTLFPKKNNFFLNIRQGTIYGTRTDPEGYGKVPAVIIIGAAGWIDRDGNSPYGINANSYKMLCDSLVKAGMIVLRYDKRGLGESAFTLPYDDSLSFDDYIDDAIGLSRFLKQYYRVSKLFVIGHNEGSLVGMKVAQEPYVDGFISISGAAKRGDELILRQTKIPDKKLRARAENIFDSLATGYLVGDVGEQLDDMLGPHKQLFLKSWLKYTPTEEIKKINKPILVLQGTKDIMIDRKDGKRLKKANNAAKLTYIDGMNFVLKDTPPGTSDLKQIYNDPNLPLSPELVPDIIGFIRGVK